MYIPLVKAGAQILLVPSAFTVPTGNAHWHTLLKARAIESQCYVLAAAQYGRHNAKRESYGTSCSTLKHSGRLFIFDMVTLTAHGNAGHSLVVDPWGTVVADAGGCDGPEMIADSNNPAETSTPKIITCDIDLDKADSVRERMPIQMHRDNAIKF
jgi:predicted amidohydrolase